MRIRVTTNAEGYIAAEVPGGTNEERRLAGSLPTNEAVIRRLAPAASALAIGAAVRQVTTERGWIANRCYSMSQLVSVLSNLRVQVSPQQICQTVAELMAEHVAQVWRSRNLSAVIDVTQEPLSLDGPNCNIPALSLETRPLLAIDGRIYTLTPSPSSDSSLVVHLGVELRTRADAHRESLRALGVGLREEGERRIAQLQLEMRRTSPLPNLRLEDVVRGLRLHNETPRQVRYYLPFHYRPLYVLLSGASRRSILSESAVALERRVVICFTQEDSSWNQPVLLQEDCSATFSHYHRNCWGTLDYHQLFTAEPVPQCLYTVRDAMERELEVVNLASLATHTPAGMPTAEEIPVEREIVRPWHEEEQDTIGSGPRPRARREVPAVQRAPEPQEPRIGWTA